MGKTHQTESVSDRCIEQMVRCDKVLIKVIQIRETIFEEYTYRATVVPSIGSARPVVLWWWWWLVVVAGTAL